MTVHDGGDCRVDGHAHLFHLGPRRAGNHVGDLPRGVDDVPRYLVEFLSQHVGRDFTDAFLGKAQRQGPQGITRNADDTGDIPDGGLVRFDVRFSRHGIDKCHLLQDLQGAVEERVDVFNVHFDDPGKRFACCSPFVTDLQESCPFSSGIPFSRAYFPFWRRPGILIGPMPRGLPRSEAVGQWIFSRLGTDCRSFGLSGRLSITGGWPKGPDPLQPCGASNGEIAQPARS